MRLGFWLASIVVLASCDGLLRGRGPSPEQTRAGDSGGRVDDARGGDVVHSVADSTPRDHTVVCPPIPGATYGTLSVLEPAAPKDPPAPLHPDINIHIRGWKPIYDQPKTLIPIAGPYDPKAPKLYTLFVDERVPAFPSTYAVREWDWAGNCPGKYLDFPYVTVLGMTTAPQEVIRTPASGYDIGDGYGVLVLYAGEDTITIKYTRADNVVDGYTIHIVGICVDPALRQVYDSCVAGGRVNLPALRGRQPFGRATGIEIQVVSRDKGSFGDPRDKSEW